MFGVPLSSDLEHDTGAPHSQENAAGVPHLQGNGYLAHKWGIKFGVEGSEGAKRLWRRQWLFTSGRKDVDGNLLLHKREI